MAEGLIPRRHDKVRDYMPPDVPLFEVPHNQTITWDHLLRQTSDWQGTLWGKPDWADRPEGKPERVVQPEAARAGHPLQIQRRARERARARGAARHPPPLARGAPRGGDGADRRVEHVALARLRELVDRLDGRKVQSMTGGGHWGGGMFINAWDMARFGYLFLRNGKWKDRQIVSEKWIEMARTPGSANREYGYMNWFLNTGRKPLPSAPETSVTFRGAGSNIIYIDWQNDLVVVVRWISGGALNEFIGKVLAAASSDHVLIGRGARTVPMDSGPLPA